MLKCLDAKMKHRGFTLLEVIIAISLVLVGTTATLLLITRTVRQIGIFPSQLIAAHLNQEGIEIVRNIRDTNFLQGGGWDEGLVPPAIDCSAGCEADYTDTGVLDPTLASYGLGRFLKIDASGFYNYTIGTNTKFKRKITIIPNGLNILEVTVETTWIEKGTLKSHTRKRDTQIPHGQRKLAQLEINKINYS